MQKMSSCFLSTQDALERKNESGGKSTCPGKQQDKRIYRREERRRNYHFRFACVDKIVSEVRIY